MSHPRLSGDEINRRGKEWYEQKIRPIVETEENIGKVISIDVETGDYAIADEPLAAGDQVLARHPDAAMYGTRIGYNAMYAIGGTLTRTAKI
jgi:hypothetical protein